MNFGYALSRLIWRQSWLGLKHKRSAYKNLCAHDEVPDAPFSKDFFGLRYEGNLSNNIEFNIFYYDAFEKPLLFFLRDTVLNIKQSATNDENSTIFCDVGANIGQHSLFMSNYASTVHAFEPYQRVSKKLKHHIQLNGITNISLHELGLSDKDEQLDFYAPTGRNLGIGSFDASTVSKGNIAAGKLSLVRGDDYFKQKMIEAVTLLKIDVEGFEKAVLRGLQATLEQQRPIIVCEITYGCELSFSSAQELTRLLPSDYQLFSFDNRKADGSKARRRGAKARRSGAYKLIPLSRWLASGQDDIVACPTEKLELLPRSNRA